MVLDYRERKPVGKNRPRKQPVGMFIAVILVTMAVSFVCGIGTGWLIARREFRVAANKAAAVAEANQKENQPATQGAPGANAGRPQEPSLTFYETLPKGGKAVIGSGLNLPKPPEHAPHATAPPAAAPPQPAKPDTAAKPETPAEPATPSKEAAKAAAKGAEPATAKEGAARGKFVVQVASYHTKKEAEAMAARLTAGGSAAYIVESNVPDKGTWYRVRIGRHLDQQAARDLAAKAGKGAIVVAE